MDIREMLIELEKRGFSLARISKESSVHESSLSFIKNGKREDLMYKSGKRLEAFYNKIVFSESQQAH